MGIDDLERVLVAGDIEGLRVILTGQPELVHEKTQQGVKPLMLAAYYGIPSTVHLISKYIQDLNFFEAVVVGDLEKVGAELLRDTHLISQFSEDGFTALGLACLFNHQEVAEYLLRNGADPNICASNGFNVYPLHSACINDHFSMAKLLCDYGASVNVAQIAGLSPLHISAEFGNIELIILLLEQGAKTDLRMEGGKLPADLAQEKGYNEIAEILRI